MNPCPNCNRVPEDPQARYCTECGAPLSDTVSSNSSSEKDTDPDFIVSEASTPDTEIVGTGSKLGRPDNDLGIETPDQQLQRRAGTPQNVPVAKDEDSLIGDTMTPFAFEPEPYEPPPAEHDMFGGADRQPSEPSAQTDEELDPDAIPRLSQEEVQAIERRMSQTANYLSDDEKRRLIEQMDKLDQPFSNTPIVPPKRREGKDETPVKPEVPPAPFDDMRRSEASMRPPRYAYYYRNWIQLSGHPHLHDGDNLTLAENSFVLKAKTLSAKLVLLIGGPLAALLLFVIAVQLVGPTGAGDGSIAGLVVDEYSRPYIHGALVRLPELGKHYQVNPEGFFVTDALPSGTHRLEFVIDGTVIGAEDATVADGRITTVTLRPSEDVVEELAQTEVTAQSSGRNANMQQATSVRNPVTPAQTAANTSSTPPSGKQGATGATAGKPSSGTQKKQSGSEYAKLTLKANVDGAKLLLDGAVVGAGNLTFSRLSPGKHKYSVTADGYQTASGTVTLTPNETNLLVVDLQPMTQASKQESYGAEDFYYSGATLMREGSLEQALEDLTEALRLDPSYTEAYEARGEAYLQQRRFKLAHDDYLRAAEIYRMRKQYNSAITAFNNALKADDHSVAAHMGRASLFVAKGELLAAIADYESVIRVDRGNFEAYFGLGEARYKRGNFKAAIDHFKDARSLRSSDPLVYQYLMLCYLGDNDIKNVNKSYEKFVEVASQEDVDAMRSDSKYAAVLRVVEKE